MLIGQKYWMICLTKIYSSDNQQWAKRNCSFSMICLILISSMIVQVFGQVSFRGHKLLAVTPSNEKQLEYLKRLSSNEYIDTWNPPTGINTNMTLRVEPKTAERLERRFRNYGMTYRVITNDIQEWVDKERLENPPVSYSSGREFALNRYHSLASINARLKFLSEHSSLVELKQIGKTYEGNMITGLKIGSPGQNRLAVWIDCGLHAREWISHATCMYIIEQLVTGYRKNKEIQQMVENFDWYIFPVMNPDGYNFTSINRFWRKNRSPSRIQSGCIGVDLNRNFDENFGGTGSGTQPCGEVYQGDSAFSEAETQAMRKMILSIGEKLKLYVSFHSFLELYMSPYAFKSDLAPDYKDHMKVMEAATTALRKVHGKKYKYGPIKRIMGIPASGSAVDWVYDSAKVKYSFGVELRDSGEHGFKLPREQIIPTAEENFAALKTIVKMVHAEYTIHAEYTNSGGYLKCFQSLMNLLKIFSIFE